MNFGKRGASGFTLIELVVVLVIIGMLAAVVITKLDDVPNEADSVINKENINELNKFVQMHSAMTSLIPSKLDSLVDNTGTAVNMPAVLDGFLTVDNSVNSTELNAINALGIQQVYEHVPGDPLDAQLGTFQTITGANALIRLDPTVFLPQEYINIMGEMIEPSTLTDNLFVFGMGPHHQPWGDVRVGNVSHCPLVNDPNNLTYDRYLLVIRVTGTEAEYVGFIDPVFEACRQF
jgi:prepilin-type N-terminal cleavage/methylation domain-containing protein